MHKAFAKAILETINTGVVTRERSQTIFTYNGKINNNPKTTVRRDLIEINVTYHIWDADGNNSINIKFTDSLYKFISIYVWDNLISDIQLSRYDTINITNNMQQTIDIYVTARHRYYNQPTQIPPIPPIGMSDDMTDDITTPYTPINPKTRQVNPKAFQTQLLLLDSLQKHLAEHEKQ